jgi:hypothetical protein
MIFFIIFLSFCATATAAYIFLAFKNYDRHGNNYTLNPKNFRGLFQPTEEDIRAFEKAEKETAKAKLPKQNVLNQKKKYRKLLSLCRFGGNCRQEKTRLNCFILLRSVKMETFITMLQKACWKFGAKAKSTIYRRKI